MNDWFAGAAAAADAAWLNLRACHAKLDLARDRAVIVLGWEVPLGLEFKALGAINRSTRGRVQFGGYCTRHRNRNSSVTVTVGISISSTIYMAMALLTEIQASLLAENAPIAPVLLKFKFLAARLQSQPLQDWITYELEGYPNDVEVPNYRKFEVAYRGTFSGPFGSGINNAPIPSYLIQEFAGENWTTYTFRQSIAAADDLLRASNGSSVLHVNSSNLILLLQGKIYEGYACNDITGSFSVSQLSELQHAVRGKLLDLTLEFEKLPGADQIEVGTTKIVSPTGSSQAVTQIFNQTVHGTMQNVNNTGSIESVTFNGSAGDANALISFLAANGIAQVDAKEFAGLLKSEKPEGTSEPFGQKAKNWIATNIKKATDGTWKVGIAVATDVLSKGALAYYGLT